MFKLITFIFAGVGSAIELRADEYAEVKGEKLRVEAEEQVNFLVKEDSRGLGMCLVANKDFDVGEVGEKMSRQNEKVESIYTSNLFSCFKVQIGCTMLLKVVYTVPAEREYVQNDGPTMHSVQLTAVWHIDFEKACKGAENTQHSSDPNGSLHYVADETKEWGVSAIEFRARKQIKKDDLLTFHYCTTEWDMAAPFDDLETGENISGRKNMNGSQYKAYKALEPPLEESPYIKKMIRKPKAVDRCMVGPSGDSLILLSWLAVFCVFLGWYLSNFYF